ncbi:MAG: hypothetical protein JKY53_01050 [Flavobacteriales bacterium]|nr:hypothetical protein [Flavobacteriales bacterium]
MSLIIKYTQKSVLLAVVAIVCLASSVSAQKYALTPFPDHIFCGGGYPSAYEAVGTFVLYETDRKGFEKNKDRNLVFTLPAGFEFNTAVGSVSFAAGRDINNVTINSITATTLDIQLDMGSDAVTDTIYFTSFQIRATAAGSGDLLRTGGNSKVDGSVDKPGDGAPETAESFGYLFAGVDMSYTSSTTTQANTNNIGPNSINGEIIGIQIITTDLCTPFNVTQFDLSTNGTSNAAVDITGASIYYTGTSSAFATTTLFGTQATPNGAFTITGSQQLTIGTNYFWLTYDLPSGATMTNVVDGECTSITMDGGVGAQVPTTTAPGGTRTIAAFYSRNGGGDWETNATWSNVAYGGIAAASIPGPLDDVFIGDGDVVTVKTKQDGTAGKGANIIRVEDTGTLMNDGGRDIWTTNDIYVTGTGVLNLSGKIKVNGNAYFTGTGTSVFSDDVHFKGDLTVDASATLRQTGDKDINIGEGNIAGDLILNGLIDYQGNKDIKLKCTCTSTIDGTGSITSNNPGTELKLENGNRTFLATANITTQAWINIANGITVTNNGIVNTVYNGVAEQGGINVKDNGGIWTNAANSTLNYGGADELLNSNGNNKTRTLNASGSGNTVNYNYNGNQNIIVPNGTTYWHLSSSTNGNKDLLGALDVNGNILITNTASLRANGSDFTVAGNWTNNSINADPFVQGTRKVTLDGAAAQVITVVSDEAYYDLEIANTSGGVSLALATDVTSTNQLTLTSGVVTTGANYLINTSTTAANVTRTGGHVYGNMRRFVASNTSTYIFPVGSNTASTDYHPIDFINNNVTGVTYLTAFVGLITEAGNNIDSRLTATQNGTSVINIFETAEWDLAPDVAPTGGSYGVNLYTGNLSAGLVDNAFCPLKRVSSSTDYADWASFEGSTTIPAAGTAGRTVASGYAQRTGYTSFSRFAVSGSGSVPLPIELISFEAHLNIDQVDLKWITASEKNNAFFTIERSTDGVTFEEILRSEGAGTSNNRIEYFDIDYDPVVGVVYYRLKQTDFDGKFAYSGLVPVEYTANGKPGISLFGDVEANIKIWPNPNNGTHVNIEMSGYIPDHEVLVIVRDIAGREYYSKVLITDIDGHIVSAIDPTQTLPVGTYLITGSDQNHLYSKKLIVK